MANLTLPKLSRGMRHIPFEWFTGMESFVRANAILPGDGVEASTTPNGTTLKVKRKVNPFNFVAFRVEGATGGNVFITGGDIIFPYNGVVVVVAGVDPMGTADGNDIWIEYNGGNAWAFNTGSGWPTGKLYFPLVEALAVDGDGNVTIEEDSYVWDGGDIVLPEFIPVLVAKDGGTNGDGVTNSCTFTYTVTAHNGAVLGTAMTPTVPRIPKMPYKDNGATGLARFMLDGTFALRCVFEEIPDLSALPTQDFITNLQLDATNGLQKKTVTAPVLPGSAAESAWTNVAGIVKKDLTLVANCP